MKVVAALADFPPEAPAAVHPRQDSIPCWPLPWQRFARCGKRTLAWLAGNRIQTETGARVLLNTSAGFASPGDDMPAEEGGNHILLRDAVIANNLLLFVRDEEFDGWARRFLRTGECLWNPAHDQICGLRFKSGRKTYYVYRGAQWLLRSASDLHELRAFFLDMGAGDTPTPGTLGAALLARFFPLGETLRRPPWAAWHDLHDNLQGGRTELLEGRGGDYAELTEVDIDNAYATALAKGAPAGTCIKLFCEEDARECEWTYSLYRWRLPERDARPDPFRDGVGNASGERLGTRLGRGRLRWHHDGGIEYEGWYTGAEITAARHAGYHCDFVRGWGWTAISAGFAEWHEWCSAARAAYAARGQDRQAKWLKLAMVAGIGRFGMDRYEYRVSTADAEDDTPQGVTYLYSKRFGQEYDAVSVSVHEPSRERNYLLPQLAVHVHAQTRIWMDTFLEVVSQKDATRAVMRNIDAWYVQASPAWCFEVIESIRGENGEMCDWKIKQLTPRKKSSTIQVQAAGWIKAGNLTKTPGVKHG